MDIPASPGLGRPSTEAVRIARPSTSDDRVANAPVELVSIDPTPTSEDLDESDGSCCDSGTIGLISVETRELSLPDVNVPFPGIPDWRPDGGAIVFDSHGLSYAEDNTPNEATNLVGPGCPSEPRPLVKEVSDREFADAQQIRRLPDVLVSRFASHSRLADSLARISSAVLTQWKGLERSFHCRVNVSIMATSSLTLRKLPAGWPCG